MKFKKEVLQTCCVSTKWLERGFVELQHCSDTEFLIKQEEIWWQLEPSDWLQAFEGHPRIGDVSSLAEKFKETESIASSEQSGVDRATDDILVELKEYNDRYFERYGFIFIVCASGKSALEMLSLLKDRMNNSRDDEIKIAAGEQAKITKIRLERQL